MKNDTRHLIFFFYSIPPSPRLLDSDGHMTSLTILDKYVGWDYDVRDRRKTIEIQTIGHNNAINNFEYGPSVPFSNDSYVRCVRVVRTTRWYITME